MMSHTPRGVLVWKVRYCLAGLVGLGVGAGFGLAQTRHMAGSGADLLESGPPAFSVASKETLGLNSPPQDIRQMPDGRILVYGTNEIALGDGVRWEVFRHAATDPVSFAPNVAVAPDGNLYLTSRAGFARVDFDQAAQWHMTPVADWPASRGAVPRFMIESGGEWFWHSGSGDVQTWKPGQPARSIGSANGIEHVFAYHGAYFISDHTSGSLIRVQDGKSTAVDAGELGSANDTVTCSLPFGDEMLVGTYGRGLRIFNGTRYRPFPHNELIAANARINAVSATEGGLYVAAVQGTGLVFFNAEGRTLQILGRHLDHRLARINKLVPAPGGVIWGLLSEGVLRVEFPSRYSSYEPLLGTSVHVAHPHRLDGRLWVMSDGRAFRAQYDELGRLVDLEPDSPADRFVFTFSSATGQPLVGTQAGAYVREEKGWRQFDAPSVNLRLIGESAVNGRWLFAARGELGWLRRGADGLEVAERFPLKELGVCFGNLTDAQGDIWLELGTAQLARVRLAGDRPEVTFYGVKEGLAQGWAQVFTIDGKVRVNIAERILRFNEPAGRFEPDAGFGRGLPPYTMITGRPGVDARGRLWIAADTSNHVFESQPGGGWKEVTEKMPPGLLPFYYTFESGGVVWMHSEGRFVRYDPDVPVAKPVAPRAIITHVSLLNSKRTIFQDGKPLAALDYADNSIVAHFVAPGDPFGPPVVFEVMLEGAGRDWTPAGSSGSAVFNSLGEGRYVLRVRPRAGNVVGEEASLAFTINPPWYRSGGAYIGYVLAVLGLVWVIALLQRRENARLEQLVAQRTKELNDTNSRLANQVEEIRLLSQAIEQSPVAILITNPAGVIVFGNPRLCEITGYTLDQLIGHEAAILRAGAATDEPWPQMAEALQRGEAWHGQFINRHKGGRQVPVRATVSPLRSPRGEIRLHLFLEEDITEWLAEQDRRRKLEVQLAQSQKLESLGTLAGGIAHDFNNILTGILGYTELARFAAGGDRELLQQLGEIHKAGVRAKDLVAQILTFSRQSTTQLVPIDLAGPVEEAVRLLRASTPASIEIVASLESGTVRADATQIQQVVLNLGTNAVHAMRNRNGRIEITLRRMAANPALAAEISHLPEGPCMCLRVRDEGDGMDAATMERIFDPFFTTKAQGEGTGLGLAIVQGIIAGHHGACRVQSSLGQGTVFELYFPLRWEQTVAPPPVAPAPKGARQEILVVDDEAMVAEYITHRLRRLDYAVTTFNDPREALAACQASPCRFQGIVTDLTMPHLTGIDLIRQIRQLGRVIPAVIVTGYGKNGNTNQLPRCETLHKPFSGEDLARTLAQVLRR